MDCHSVTLYLRTMSAYLSLLFLLFLSVPLQGAITITGTNPVPCGPDDGYYLVDFTISGLPDLQANPDFYPVGTESRYAIFFYFGDGSHVELIVPGDQNSVSCQHIYEVEMNSPAEFILRAEVTKVYLPSDPGTERVFSQTEVVEASYNREFLGSGTASCSACETEIDAGHLPGRDFFPLEIDEGEGRWVQRIRNAVPGDHFTLAIHYGFDICQVDAGNLNINYPSNIFNLKWASEDVDIPGLDRISFDFSYSETEDITDKMLYLSFEVESGFPVNQEYQFRFDRRYADFESCDGTVSNNDSFVELVDRAKSGHDPNAKFVEPRFFTSPGPTTLSYLIRFYNEGLDPVDSIMIKDELDSQLDFTSISDIKFWTGNSTTPQTPNEIPLEPTDDPTFKWNIGPLLPPGGLVPTKGKVPKDNEWAYLSFKVNTTSQIAPETCIPNTAEIFFYFANGTERNIVEEVVACRTCCQRNIAPKDTFYLGDSDTTIIWITSAPASLQRIPEGGFIFNDDNFSQAQIIYRECVRNESGALECSYPKSITICNQAEGKPTCETSPPPPPPPPYPTYFWWIILLLLISAALIAIAARRSPNI